MARLIQNLNNSTFYQGWYGTCPDSNSENTCDDFDLIEGVDSNAKKLHSEIQNVYMIRNDALGQLSYNGNIADGELQNFQQIKKLECGQSY